MTHRTPRGPGSKSRGREGTPIGARGLEYTEKARSLDGRRVRILGFMVRTCAHDYGRFLLTPFPITLHDHEMGPADDLPPATVFVDVPPLRKRMEPIPFEPGPFLLTGTLSLGGRDERYGRRSWVRLRLERPGFRPNTDAAPGVSPVASTPSDDGVDARRREPPTPPAPSLRASK